MDATMDIPHCDGRGGGGGGGGGGRCSGGGGSNPSRRPPTWQRPFNWKNVSGSFKKSPAFQNTSAQDPSKHVSTKFDKRRLGFFVIDSIALQFRLSWSKLLSMQLKSGGLIVQLNSSGWNSFSCNCYLMLRRFLVSLFSGVDFVSAVAGVDPRDVTASLSKFVKIIYKLRIWSHWGLRMCD